MSKNSNTTDEVRASVSSIYSELLEKRRIEREEKEAKRLKAYEEKQRKKEEQRTKEDGTKMTKKERRESELASWENVIIGLTGDDLEYIDDKKKNKKKKYRKWIDDETDNTVTTAKPKKKKKKNYQKEFEPELRMLKSIVADQNRFTADLQKRFQNAAGPSTKDGSPLNKTLVDLASVVNNSRQNSLGMLNAISSIKKTISELYFKQLKADSDLAGAGFNTQDLGLMGSSIASSMFSDNVMMGSPVNISSDNTSTEKGYQETSSPQTFTEVNNTISQPQSITTDSFDPSSWEGPSLGENNSTMYENIPHSIVVEWHKDKDIARFKAVRDDTGEELSGCPVPTSDISRLKFNEKEMSVKGEFDETYKLEIV